MVKTDKESFFVLYNLSDIRSSRHIILQIQDTGANFDNGQKCYLCECTNPLTYKSIRDEQDLIKEICTLNSEKRRLEKKIKKLENDIEKLKKEECKNA